MSTGDGLATESDAKFPPDADHPHRNHSAVVLGGPYGGRKIGLSGAPPHVDVGGFPYLRVGDPRAGDYLGQYVFTPAGCKCPPCPGRGNDGHGMTHCAECCFGTGVEADPECPIHGYRAITPGSGAT